jgi:uncharacterized protein
VRRVFVDTGGFVALLVAEDRMHDRAATLFDTASQEHWALVRTNSVLVETYSVLLARARNGRRAAIAFRDAVQASAAALAVERVRADDELNAIALVRTHTDKSYSLCDAQSFVVMERLGVTEAVAFDRHFREYDASRSSHSGACPDVMAPHKMQEGQGSRALAKTSAHGPRSVPQGSA